MAVKIFIDADTGSNKTGIEGGKAEKELKKLELKLNSTAYCYPRPTGHFVAVQKPLVDRFAATLQVSNDATRKLLRSKLKVIAGDSKSSLVSKWMKANSWGATGYQASYQVDAGEGAKALIQHAAEDSANAFLRL